MITRNAPLLVAAATAGLYSIAPCHADEIGARDLTVEQGTVYAVAPAPSSAADPLHVSAWVDQADNTYAVGETVRLFVQASKDSYVTVFDTGPSGQTVQLFPNADQTDNHVKAGQTIAVPGLNSRTRIVATGPVGVELIKIVASTSDDPVVAVNRTVKAGDFRSITGGAEAAARDLALAVAAAPKAGAEVGVYNKLIRTIETAASLRAPAAPTAATEFVLQLGTDKPGYKIGETMAIAVTASQPCHLTLIDVGASGEAWQLFPNKAMPDNLLQAGRTLLLPGAETGVKLQVRGPAGTDTLVGVCGKAGETVLSQPVDVAEAFPKAGNADTVNRNLAVIQAMPAGSVATSRLSFPVSQ